MKKRLLSMVLTVIMLVSLIPTSVFAAKKSVDDYFDGLPIAADPGTGTTAWKVSTKDGEEVLMVRQCRKELLLQHPDPDLYRRYPPVLRV